MNLAKACTHILLQLNALVAAIKDEDFTRPSETLSKSTIGQHLRHTLEFFFCFEKGFDQGMINYDKRAHDKLIETDRVLALAALNRITNFVNTLNENKRLKLEVGYDLDKEEFISIDTNATRELVYNIEHTVHHMAIMKIGVREVAPYIQLPFDFGIAASTVRYREVEAASSSRS
jgi:hypothetical protein